MCLDERRRRVHVRAEAGAQRVDDRDGVALAHEAVDHVRADKAGDARDDVLGPGKKVAVGAAQPPP